MEGVTARNKAIKYTFTLWKAQKVFSVWEFCTCKSHKTCEFLSKRENLCAYFHYSYSFTLVRCQLDYKREIILKIFECHGTHRHTFNE